MRTTQYQGINHGIDRQDVIQMPLDEIIGSRRTTLITLDQRHPHRTGLAHYMDMGKHLPDLEGIRVGGDRSRRAQDAHMLRPADGIHQLDGRPDHA